MRSTPPAADGSVATPDARDQIIAGLAIYEGRPYYLPGYLVEHHSRWVPDRVHAIASADGSRMRLLTRDGGQLLWAPTAEVEVVERFRTPQTLKNVASTSGAAHIDP